MAMILAELAGAKTADVRNAAIAIDSLSTR
jgi:hypothetical protein